MGSQGSLTEKSPRIALQAKMPKIISEIAGKQKDNPAGDGQTPIKFQVILLYFDRLHAILPQLGSAYS